MNLNEWLILIILWAVLSVAIASYKHQRREMTPEERKQEDQDMRTW